MSDTAITVNRLGKRYSIGVAEKPQTRLAEAVAFLAAPLKYLRTALRQPTEEETIWALRNVSFEVGRGEVVGIIGRNGAGKSTLLKVLSRITEPTEGEAEIRGRVGSLLEVGTGFHHELTGRENIYLSGAILGMKKSEIARKFDEIVAFAEVEKFIDTPVKRYSSGMYVRLAFAVAAHLEPEILLVDEVLAVGDVAFQKKCLGKMGDVARQGRTVLFVSHNMQAIQSLCSQVVLLENGRLCRYGAAREVVVAYLASAMAERPVALDQRKDRHGDGTARLVALEVEDARNSAVIQTTSRLKFRIHYESDQPLRCPKFQIGIHDFAHKYIYLLDSDRMGGIPDVLPAQGDVCCLTEPIGLTPGRCCVDVLLFKGGTMADFVENAAFFDVEPDGSFGSGRIASRNLVICVLQHQWEVGASRKAVK